MRVGKNVERLLHEIRPTFLFSRLSATHTSAVILLLCLFGTVFLHSAQPLMHLLQVVVQRGVVVVWEAMLRNDAGVGGRPDI